MNVGIVIKSKDVNKLIAHLHKNAFKWKEIGGALDFEQGELENIGYSGGTPQQLLTKLLSEWSEWPTDDHPTKPTLDSLCAALRSGTVKLGGAADDIYAKVGASTMLS